MTGAGDLDRKLKNAALSCKLCLCYTCHYTVSAEAGQPQLPQLVHGRLCRLESLDPVLCTPFAPTYTYTDDGAGFRSSSGGAGSSAFGA